MTAYPKRLIEVDLPIARISAHARREKSIRHGHISTLHIWWARRPLAACRAVILASLWPDPVDLAAWLRLAEEEGEAGEMGPQVRAPRGETLKPGEGVWIRPQRFLEEARERMAAWAREALVRRRDGQISEESYEHLAKVEKREWRLDTPEQVRTLLLDFIADFADWKNSTDPDFLATSRALVQAAHEALGGESGSRPMVVDPFAGGGSIPLEALRVGADAFASDLNPIPVLLNKVVLEYIPKYGQRLADEVREWGQWVKERAEEELADFYPKDPDGATPIAYLWARTILSEAPGQGTIPVEVPLMRSLWLAKKKGRKRALRWVRDERGNVKTKTAEVTYRIDGEPTPMRVKRPVLEIFEPEKDSEVEDGTVARGNATCPVTGHTTRVDSVRAQLKRRRGGAADARLFAVVTTRSGEQGRFYRLPNKADVRAFDAAAAELAARLEAEGGASTQRSQVLTRVRGGTVQVGMNSSGTLSMVPDEPTPLGGGKGAGRAFSQRNYGMDYFTDLFSPRQLLALTTLARLVREAGERMRDETEGEASDGLGDAVQACLALPISKIADFGNSLTRWGNDDQGITACFSRQAIPMVWDFAESSPAVADQWGWSWALQMLDRIIGRNVAASFVGGEARCCSAIAYPLPDNAASALIADPPYYDAVPYSDLSDFFYVWLKRTLPASLTSTFADALTPKEDECIVDDAKGKDHAYFESTMTAAMAEGRRVTQRHGVGVVVFAHKSTAGWEAQLKGMIDAGWIITGSWPIDTEMHNRLRAQDSAALASSVHLAMRPRGNPDGSLATSEVGEWREILAELPERLDDWMPRLAAEGVVGADAIFACLGPALEIFSRYSRVEKASGEEVALREYLEQVWAAVSNEALSMIFKDADAAGLEPDARLTAMWLWTLGAGAGVKAASRKGVEAAAAEGDADADEEDPAAKKAAAGGFKLEFDAARKIAQGLGIHLEKSESVVEVKGDTARLLPVAERVRHLFGKDAAEATPRVRRKKQAQQGLFQELEAIEAEAESGNGRFGGLEGPKPGATVLDKVHQAMILFASGRGEALRRFLVDDGVGKDGRFWKLGQALSALYPAGTDEKRWVDGVLARKRGLGL